MKFEQMNNSQLSDKQSELNEDISILTDELNAQNAKLTKVCEIANFDPELAEFSKKELKEIGVQKPKIVETISIRIKQLQEEINKKEGMVKATKYYIAKNDGQ